jgi:hypothetical protein
MATPNTNIILQKYANGVRDVKSGKFYPFVSLGLISTIEPKQNVRYFVDTVTFVYTMLVTDTGTSVYVTAPLNGQDNYLAQFLTSTLTAGTGYATFTPQVLLDKEGKITLGKNGTYTGAKCVVTYAEVIDLG